MAHLFDHLFGGGEELRTDFKSERLRGLEINRELKFGGLPQQAVRPASRR